MLYSCVDTGLSLDNENGTSHDVCDFFVISILDTMANVRIDFAINGMYNEEDIQKYSSSHSRLKYYFSVTPHLPIIKLNSFSFTSEKGDTIPSVLYYKTRDTNNKIVTDIIVNDSFLVVDGTIINIIDSFPAIFTNDIKNEMKGGFRIFAECSKSYREIKTININYDIEVGNEHFIKQCKYEKKRYWDWRPKIW